MANIPFTLTFAVANCSFFVLRAKKRIDLSNYVVDIKMANTIKSTELYATYQIMSFTANDN